MYDNLTEIGIRMSVSYKKLWKLLIDKDMNKTDLRNATGLSTFTVAKMSRGENVNTSILTRICEALNCDIGDIVEVRQEKVASKSAESIV